MTKKISSSEVERLTASLNGTTLILTNFFANLYDRMWAQFPLSDHDFNVINNIDSIVAKIKADAQYNSLKASIHKLYGDAARRKTIYRDSNKKVHAMWLENNEECENRISELENELRERESAILLTWGIDANSRESFEQSW